jgi:hypothetical protein
VGVCLSWFAVKGLSRDAALEELGLELTRQTPRDELPERMGVAELSDEWLLFLTDDLEQAFEERFVSLSRHGPAIACALEEHVMYSEARGYEGGVETWRAVHDSSKGIYRIDVSGDPPEGFEQIHIEATRQQDAEGGEDAGCDYMFDVPADVARSICGYKFGDADPDPLFSEMRRVSGGSASTPDRPSFFQRLFGRR